MYRSMHGGRVDKRKKEDNESSPSLLLCLDLGIIFVRMILLVYYAI